MRLHNHRQSVNSREISALNDQRMKKHRNLIIKELKDGTLKIREIAEAYGISEHRISQFAQSIGIDGAERRTRLQRARAKERADAKIAQIAAELKNPEIGSMKLAAMAKYFACSAYLIYDAAEKAGVKIGVESGWNGKSDVDRNMAGDLSRKWLAMPWIKRQTPWCFYYGGVIQDRLANQGVKS